ncbi:aspartate--tRNA ligase MSD1 NDAI_0E02610 [Naumovozyma dairenensis CBS 421]|uniref:Aminoacyl-transfer RNA synthetases class-II family profile domain-containing protein n=1 Tax=Naumovozyma dairenensis (strain ATCC 10597 / BCRC 20456 / CBS 421 / NBRC 0211 / NRRL Y-12639) TaxID=1071378 RepID=G0WBF8_NAUDC|nr:hypothetical protein NDAI_0E02610 [Naumovozyma dairenensis CBS 421]CCD25078.1 hypothetical protein NDAI_0E02610 [Naumovozyma dairenensis CBS 421]
MLSQLITGNRCFLSTRTQFIRSLTKLPDSQKIRSQFVFQRKGSIKAINELYKENAENIEVSINGWIDNKPKHIGKNISFGVLRDPNGDTIQLVDSHSLLKGISRETVVQVKGTISSKKNSNLYSNRLEYELKLNELSVLNLSNDKPSQLQDFKERGNYPPQYRYLQLRNPKYSDFLKKRYEISRIVRDILNKENFLEIETPILFKPTPEGAREFLVPTRVKKAKKGIPTFYSLTQSPQQYKQLLMASGFSNYFQVARCFRDEDLRADRQPEFTQIDLEMSFASGNDVMQLLEQLVPKTWDELSITGELFTLDHSGKKLIPVHENRNEIYRLTYQQAMSLYGIDKPDLRAPDLKIVDLSEFRATANRNKKFPTFEVIVLRNAFDSIENYKENWHFLDNAQNYTYRTPLVVPITNDEAKTTWFEKFQSIAAFENPKMISKFLNLKQGDIICGSTREPNGSIFENPTPLGTLRKLVLQSEIGKRLYRETDHDVASWVIDFPLFSPLTNEPAPNDDFPIYQHDRLMSTHHPFTMVNLSDYNKLNKNPTKCRGQHYDLVINGIELGGGSTRVHDPELQNFIFESILKIENSEELFGHLLNAFAMGTPPHAGFAIGFDRMCAMLCGTESIRDVLAFPKSITGTDLVVKSPSLVDEDVLKLYNIEYKKN